MSLSATVQSANTVRSPVTGETGALIAWRISLPGDSTDAHRRLPISRGEDVLASGRLHDELVVAATGGTVLVLAQELVLFGGKGKTVSRPRLPTDLSALLTEVQRQRSFSYTENVLRQGDRVLLTATVKSARTGSAYRASVKTDFVVCPDREPTMLEWDG